MWPIFKYKQSGLSLVEVVIYVALLSVLLLASISVLLSISKTYRELVAWQSLQSEGVSIMDRLAREIRAADEVASGGVFSTSLGRLILSTTGLSGGTLANTVFGVEADDSLYLKIGSAATSTLTSRTEVRSLIFRHITTGAVEAIRVELSLGVSPGLSDKTINLYNTIILRSSYAN